MKIICIDNTHPQAEPVFFIKPDTALLRNNQAFYYPDFTKELFANVSLVLRVNRLGRSIAEHFASRYFDAIGIGIDLFANDLLQLCQQQTLPWDTARNFDYSAPISPVFTEINKFKDLRSIPFSLSVNCKNKIESNSTEFPHTFEQIIACISKYITLKIGDYICISAPVPAISVKIGDELRAYMGEEELLRTAIK